MSEPCQGCAPAFNPPPTPDKPCTVCGSTVPNYTGLSANAASLLREWDRVDAAAELAKRQIQQRQPLPRQYPAYGRTQPPRLVTHVDGDQYIHLGTAHGAGKSRGAPAVEIYRSIEDGRLWFRDPADFADRMKP